MRRTLPCTILTSILLLLPLERAVMQAYIPPTDKAVETADAGMRLRESAAARRALRVTQSLMRPRAAQVSSVAAPPSRPAVPLEKFSIPILVYHHIRPTGGYNKATWSWKMSVSPATFKRHMQWLEDRGYTPVTLDTLVAILKGECQGPVKPVVITFDDNNRTQYTEAFPVLKNHWFKAVFYMVANRMENPAFVSRAEMAEMAEAGMDIQSHTLTHAWMTNRTPAQLDAELLESRRILEEISGRPVRHLAYPSVMHNAVVRARTKELGYATATIMDPRNMTEKDDWFRIPRIMMTDDTNLARVLP